ncbi:alginate lyase [Ruegeria conchae]|uniref:Alginate lyase n=2 Tax=Ruegeria conchae TaxID=981384 RepID=A0A497ZBL0_9RHOB|nr:alginate lyase [Ruegeria conchae]
MLEQLKSDFKRSSPLIRISIIALFPLYLLYRLHRYRRDIRRNRINTSFSVQRMGDISGTLRDVKQELIDPKLESEINDLADTFALCRIVGNDLEPRHKVGQSLSNVRFILDNEPEFDGVKKLWLLNRIFNTETEAKIISLLEERGQTYRRIAFDPEEYQSIGYSFDKFKQPDMFYDGHLEIDSTSTRTTQAIMQAYRVRNNYVMHNNGARNAALEFCLEYGKWALPFDGNCFLTSSGWARLHSNILEARDKRYFVVPMARITNNQDLLEPNNTFSAEEEPQLVFRCDAPLRFNEDLPYGRRPKVELFMHLGIEGPWKRWPVEDFDIPPRRVHPDGHRVGQAGWVARLASGKAHLEQADRKAFVNRGLARAAAIRSTLDMLSMRPVRAALAQDQALTYDLTTADPAQSEDWAAVREAAQQALDRGPFSVTQKPEPGPSGDLRDYFHPAPYWWPNPNSKDGLPYVRRDGERLPGTELYEAESGRFDRTRLQRVFDDTTALALASTLQDADPSFHAHACSILRTWFLDAETGMKPNLSYAQVRLGHQGNMGAAHGVIETKDFYFLLDAVRLLRDSHITDRMKEWSSEFFDWFTDSVQGRQECRAANNHGTCYDLQAASLAAFLEKEDILQAIDLRAQARAISTITPDGDQPHELQRTLTQHYWAFNLQSWVNLFDLLSAAGLRPWQSEAGERVRVGLRRMLMLSKQNWEHPQIKPFDSNRLLPLNETLKNQTGEDILGRAESDGPVSFFPHDGVAPFWRLTRLGR